MKQYCRVLSQSEIACIQRNAWTVEAELPSLSRISTAHTKWSAAYCRIEIRNTNREHLRVLSMAQLGKVMEGPNELYSLAEDPSAYEDISVLLPLYMECWYAERVKDLKFIRKCCEMALAVGSVYELTPALFTSRKMLSDILACDTLPRDGNFPECRPWVGLARMMIHRNCAEIVSVLIDELNRQNMRGWTLSVGERDAMEEALTWLMAGEPV